jgi:hypothetical protein
LTGLAWHFLSERDNLFRVLVPIGQIRCEAEELYQGKNSSNEKVHHSYFSALCSGDDAGFLRERTSDDNDHNASDHCDYGTTVQTHAGHRLPRQ